MAVGTDTPGSSGSSLLVFSDDWGRHPSSCQHLVQQLLPRHAVVWVNTIGTRLPSLDRYTLGRAGEKIAAWARPQRGDGSPVQDEGLRPRVIDPPMWPSFGSRLARGINRRLLQRAIERELPPGPVHAITTLPLVADLVGELPVERWLYYCVDDLSVWPGLDGDTLRQMENELLERVDEVVCVSEALQRRIAGLGRESTILTHGVDLQHWRQDRDSLLPDALSQLPRPWVVFWGVIDGRLDIAVVRALADQLQEGSIVLLGPVNQPAPPVVGLARVYTPGPVPYASLPAVAREMAVAIMPYADIAATRAMQPLKLKEYLATGKPVVVTDLPAVREWRDACDVEGSPEKFARRVLERLRAGLPAEQASARQRLQREDWTNKAARLEAILLHGEGGS